MKPEQVDIVVNTHLHFDHCGWNTRMVDGKLVPTFPNARYIVQRGELEHARHPSERDRASYFPENFEPMAKTGQWSLIEEDEEIAPGVRVDSRAGPQSRHDVRAPDRRRANGHAAGRSGAHDGAFAAALDHGLRSLPDGRRWRTRRSGFRKSCAASGWRFSRTTRRSRRRGCASETARSSPSQWKWIEALKASTRTSCGSRVLNANEKDAAKRSPAKRQAEIGIIGGSGLYSMPGLERAREVRVKTPFGDPSDALVVGTLEGRRVAFLARHGRGHRVLPSEINYRANLYAMKLLGVERVISVSAVGSLQEDLRPLEFLIPDQFYDRTRARISTFFGGGIVAHVGFDNPTCAQLGGVLGDACDAAGVKAHGAARTSASRGRNFRRWRRRTCTGSCALK